MLRLHSMSLASCSAYDLAQVYKRQTAWQPPMSDLGHRDASDPANLLFPASGSWSKVLSLKHLLMHREARVEQVAVHPLVFLDSRLCLSHRDTRCNAGSGQCVAARSFSQMNGDDWNAGDFSRSLFWKGEIPSGLFLRLVQCSQLVQRGA